VLYQITSRQTTRCSLCRRAVYRNTAASKSLMVPAALLGEASAAAFSFLLRGCLCYLPILYAAQLGSRFYCFQHRERGCRDDFGKKRLLQANIISTTAALRYTSASRVMEHDTMYRKLNVRQKANENQFTNSTASMHVQRGCQGDMQPSFSSSRPLYPHVRQRGRARGRHSCGA